MYRLVTTLEKFYPFNGDNQLDPLVIVIPLISVGMVVILVVFIKYRKK